MRLGDNSIKTLKAFFHSELGSFFDENEINIFFYWLIDHEKKWSKADTQLHLNERLSESELLFFLSCIKRLKNKEPIQYIVGEVEFAGCTLKVNPYVLIPRPETEELVYEIIRRLDKSKVYNMLDLCSGSGCIALGLKKNFKEASVRGMDVSEKAIELAMTNALNNRLEVEFICQDVLSYRPPENVFFDLVVSNPPYVLNAEKAEMSSNVLDFEPHLALFVENNDPLLFYRSILANFCDHISKHGMIVFEINEKYGLEVVNLFDSRQFSVELIKDLQEKDRMVIAKKL